MSHTSASVEPQSLCSALLHADYEEGENGVIAILSDAGFWNDPSCWRDLGDEPENYSTVGSQQSKAEQAFVEKLVNAGDTKLIAAARIAGIDPTSSSAPPSMAKAREQLFSEELKSPDALARSITVASTGARSPGRMSLTITDDGEGQTPSSMPKTILSVLKGSKKLIPFVQGKFHMGGTGVLEFCGKNHNLQLVISRRNPALLAPGSPDIDGHWSFTILRRVDPEVGGRRSSRFQYLAPGEPGDDGRRTLLDFPADSLPICPERNQAYARLARWGTLFKLYEYDTRLKGNIILRDGLMSRVRIMLPEPAFPIRFHECRAGFKGHTGSFDTTMKGVIGTLDDDRNDEKRDAVEFFDRFQLNVDGELFSGRIYLFKDTKTAETYRQTEGLVLTFNGQTHATYTKDFFRRSSVKQDYLWNSLLVFVDCSAISPRAHEILFMASRDRLRDGELKRSLEDALEREIRENPRLKQKAAERRSRERQQQPEVSETFKKFLEEMLKKNPALAALLGPGLRLTNPHKPTSVGVEDAPYQGERFPSYFRFKKMDDGAHLKRDAHLNAQARLSLETDAENEYFSRDDQPGTFELHIEAEGGQLPAKNWGQPKLSDGVANFRLALPPDAAVGDQITYEAVINDPSRVEPFRNRFTLTVKAEQAVSPPGPTTTPKPPAPRPGDVKSGPSTLDIPDPTEVTEDRWHEHDPPFERDTALVIKASPDAPDGIDAYDYFVNMDNIHLQSATKSTPKKASLFRRQFKFGMTMLALSVIQRDATRSKTVSDQDEAERQDWAVGDQVKELSSAFAPFLLPMISSLSSLPDEEEALSGDAGEEAA